MQQYQNVNESYEILTNQGKIWVKHYLSHAASTGISLPLGRQMVEQRICHLLKQHVNSKVSTISTPDAIHLDLLANKTYFHYVENVSLRNLSISSWPDSKTFFDLGLFIATIEAWKSDEICEVFCDYEDSQSEIGEIIRIFKGSCLKMPLGQTVALGDVSLGNIGSVSTGLFIYDFEFAHREAAGFDIGQLLAELDARAAAIAENYDNVTQPLCAGYTQAGGSMTAAQRWRDALGGYYQRRYKFLGQCN